MELLLKRGSRSVYDTIANSKIAKMILRLRMECCRKTPPSRLATISMAFEDIGGAKRSLDMAEKIHPIGENIRWANFTVRLVFLYS